MPKEWLMICGHDGFLMGFHGWSRILMAELKWLRWLKPWERMHWLRIDAAACSVQKGDLWPFRGCLTRRNHPQVWLKTTTRILKPPSSAEWWLYRTPSHVGYKQMWWMMLNHAVPTAQRRPRIFITRLGRRRLFCRRPQEIQRPAVLDFWGAMEVPKDS